MRGLTLLLGVMVLLAVFFMAVKTAIEAKGARDRGPEFIMDTFTSMVKDMRNSAEVGPTFDARFRRVTKCEKIGDTGLWLVLLVEDQWVYARPGSGDQDRYEIDHWFALSATELTPEDQVRLVRANGYARRVGDHRVQLYFATKAE